MAKPALSGVSLTNYSAIGDNVSVAFALRSLPAATSATMQWDSTASDTDNNAADGLTFSHTYADNAVYSGSLSLSNVDGTQTYSTRVGVADQQTIAALAFTPLTGAAAINIYFGNAGNAAVNAAAGAGSLMAGGAGNDVLTGGFLFNTIIGDHLSDFDPVTFTTLFAGNDSLRGGAGSDTIYGDFVTSQSGQGGNDVIVGGGGKDALFGGAGNDRFIFSTGDITSGEVIDGGFGYYGPETNSLELSGAVSFNLATLSGFSALKFSAGGTATFHASQLGQGIAYNTTVMGSSAGLDQIVFNVNANKYINLLDLTFASWSAADKIIINGSSGAETLTGSVMADTINLQIGDDHGYGFDGNDVILGDAGDDELHGGIGNDRLLGGTDDDNLLGGSGADALDGGSGDDTIQAGSGNDLAVGGSGDDVVYLGSGNDTLKVLDGLSALSITGDDGVDFYSGGSGMDTLDYSGVSGNINVDVAAGKASSVSNGGNHIGTDTFNGFEHVIGTASHDTIIGTTYSRITGGAGIDQMSLDLGVFDFNSLSDSGATIATADRLFSFSQYGEDIDLSNIDAVFGGADNAFTSVVNKASTFTYSATGANFSGSGQIITFSNGAAAVGADRIIAINTDSDQAAEMMIAVDLTNTATVFELAHFIV